MRPASGSRRAGGQVLGLGTTLCVVVLLCRLRFNLEGDTLPPLLLVPHPRAPVPCADAEPEWTSFRTCGPHQVWRRQLAGAVLAPLLAESVLRQAVSAEPPAQPEAAAKSLLETPFEWGFLWRRGDGSEAPPAKQRGLPAKEVAERLQKTLVEGKYILTGRLDPTIFSDSCRFVDPNNAVDGVYKYRQALEFLFDPAESSLDVTQVRAGDSGSTIEAFYVASGVLKLPWRPRIEPWAGHITYTLDADGLIASQVDAWNITRFDALRQTFMLR